MPPNGRKPLGKDVYFHGRVILDRAAFAVVRLAGKDVQQLADCMRRSAEVLANPSPGKLAQAVLKCMEVKLRAGAGP